MDEPAEFSTSDVSERDRLAYWRETVNEGLNVTTFEWIGDAPQEANVVMRSF